MSHVIHDPNFALHNVAWPIGQPDLMTDLDLWKR